MIEQAMLSGMATLLLTGCNQQTLSRSTLSSKYGHFKMAVDKSNGGRHGRFTLDSFSVRPPNNEVPVNKLVYSLSDHLSPQTSCPAELLYSDVKMFPGAS